ncbi:MAG: transglutaminase domain-containing protein [Lachnospiraceae bacterium]|nr:transglutaminase domain-containing protein [Lachnospiraceae bacterium]
MKRNNLLTALIAVISLLLIVVTVFIVLLCSRVKKEYSIDLGQSISAEDFKRYSWDKGSFVWIEQPDVTSEGEKKGKIQVFPITYSVTVNVKNQSSTEITDTPTITPEPTAVPVLDVTAPEVIVKDVFVFAEDYNFSEILPEQFISEVKDESSYQIHALTKPEEVKNGYNTVRISVTDAAGNSTESEATLTIINLKKSLVVELGSEFPEAVQFLYGTGSEVSFITDVSTVNIMTENILQIQLLVDGIEGTSTVYIKDTTPPKLVLSKAETWLNKPIEPKNFVDFNESSDNSDAFEIAYAAEPDWSIEGEQPVNIIATDASGNSTTKETVLLVKKDNKAPVVSVTDIDVKVGGTVSYKKAVSYYDDIDSKEEMKLSIERSGVNLKEVGTYDVTYTVTDCSGNSTSVTGKINVLNESPKWEDVDAIHEKAQGILDSILKDGMTDREKAKAIYAWIKNNIGYISHSEKGNYTRGAYEGLFKYQGDCFVYAATAKELLTLAGIQNIDIVKATKNPSHYWNLVYIEDGWYHFDSTPRKDKSEFFLLTDAELEAYSSTHKNTHIFDRSLYPEIQ